MNKENKRCSCNNSDLRIIYNNFYESYQIICANCGSYGLASNTPEEAWEKWNKRSDENDKHSS